MLRELQNIILLHDWRKPTGGAEWSAAILGGVIALIGIILALGGAKLIGVGGSWYYLFAGLALIIGGLAIVQRKLLGAWIYAGAFVVTAPWSFWEVGLNGWALMPRLVGPLVLLLLVILSLPLLDANRGRRRRLFELGGFALIVIVLVVAVARANRPDGPGAMPEPFAQAMADPSLMQVGADWPTYGGTYNAQRYSPLDQINRENVRRLERVWTFRTGDMPTERWGAETTPLKIGDTLYLCTGRSTLIAIDAASGAERWRHDPKVSDASIPYTAACRGVAYYAAPSTDPASACATRIIAGTLDARLIAVDARTGTPCADFGKNGVVDITIGMGETAPGMVSITSAPTIVRGVVITGHQVLDGQRANAPSGVVQGFDAITGALRWAWDMEYPERTGLPPKGETYARGTPNMWTTASGDEALGLVYLPLGNAAADYWSSHRSQAENKHSAALVALNAETGREVWRFQTVHMGVWDYDLGSQPTLIDFPTEFGRRSRRYPPQQTRRHLHPRPAHWRSAPRRRRTPSAGRRLGAGIAQPNATLLALSHFAHARSSRTRHVGHVANRSDDLPHSIPPSYLSRNLHTPDHRDALDSVPELQWRLRLGRDRRRSPPRRDHSQLQRPT